MVHYVVEHHKDEYTEQVVERWDASRDVQLPQPSNEKVRRVLQEETRRSAYKDSKLLKYTKTQWDSTRPAGETPDGDTMDIAYFGLEWHATEPARVRDNDYEYATLPDSSEPTFLKELAERKVRCHGVGWASEKARAYRPLGDVPLFPAQVRRRERPGPLRILGDAWIPEKQIDRGTLIPLSSGVPLDKESVLRHGKRFYTIAVTEGRRLDIRLRVHKGDPDIYVSNVHDRPDELHFVWKSMGGGESEELIIESDDPKGGPGSYYIAIIGDQASEYRIEAELVKPRIHLPPRPPKRFDHGQREICRALREAHDRRAHVAAGYVTLSALPAQLVAGGHDPDAVLEASRPAAACRR